VLSFFAVLIALFFLWVAFCPLQNGYFKLFLMGVREQGSKEKKRAFIETLNREDKEFSGKEVY